MADLTLHTDWWEPLSFSTSSSSSAAVCSASSSSSSSSWSKSMEISPNASVSVFLGDDPLLETGQVGRGSEEEKRPRPGASSKEHDSERIEELKKYDADTYEERNYRRCDGAEYEAALEDFKATMQMPKECAVPCLPTEAIPPSEVCLTIRVGVCGKDVNDLVSRHQAMSSQGQGEPTRGRITRSDPLKIPLGQALLDCIKHKIAEGCIPVGMSGAKEILVKAMDITSTESRLDQTVLLTVSSQALMGPYDSRAVHVDPPMTNDKDTDDESRWKYRQRNVEKAASESKRLSKVVRSTATEHWLASQESEVVKEKSTTGASTAAVPRPKPPVDLLSLRVDELPAEYASATRDQLKSVNDAKLLEYEAKLREYLSQLKSTQETPSVHHRGFVARGRYSADENNPSNSTTRFWINKSPFKDLNTNTFVDKSTAGEPGMFNEKRYLHAALPTADAWISTRSTLISPTDSGKSCDKARGVYINKTVLKLLEKRDGGIAFGWATRCMWANPTIETMLFPQEFSVDERQLYRIPIPSKKEGRCLSVAQYIALSSFYAHLLELVRSMRERDPSKTYKEAFEQAWSDAYTPSTSTSRGFIFMTPAYLLQQIRLFAVRWKRENNIADIKTLTLNVHPLNAIEHDESLEANAFEKKEASLFVTMCVSGWLIPAEPIDVEKPKDEAKPAAEDPIPQAGLQVSLGSVSMSG